MPNTKCTSFDKLELDSIIYFTLRNDVSYSARVCKNEGYYLQNTNGKLNDVYFTDLGQESVLMVMKSVNGIQGNGFPENRTLKGLTEDLNALLELPDLKQSFEYYMDKARQHREKAMEFAKKAEEHLRTNNEYLELAYHSAINKTETA
jgi:hypothetical protein